MRLSSVVLLFCSSATCFSGENTAKDTGFVALFNGIDLTGWKQFAGKPDSWTIDDGILVCKGGGGGWLGTERDYADFELQLEYRLKPGGNSGVYLRAPLQGHISRVGMEIQLLDDFHSRYAKLDFYQHTGAIYHVAAPTRRTGKPAGEWNSMAIRAQGRNVVVVLNGAKILDADLDRCMHDPAVAKEHTGLARCTGRIGLQSHTDRVEFRNLRIKELKQEVVSGRWSVVSGRWSVVGGRWSVVSGRWSVFGGRCSVVGGRWSVVGGGK